MTLVEVLLAATVFAMTMTGLSTHLQSSVAVWRRASASIGVSQRTDVILNQMAQDVANAVRWDPGEAEAFQPIFEDHRMAFAMVSAARVGVVAYSLEEEGGSSMLVRRWQTMPEAQAARPGRVTRVLPQAQAFSLRYGYRHSAELEGMSGIVWRDRWDHAEAFPQAIEVTLECQEGSVSSRVHRLLVSPQGQWPLVEEAG